MKRFLLDENRGDDENENASTKAICFKIES